MNWYIEYKIICLISSYRFSVLLNKKNKVINYEWAESSWLNINVTDSKHNSKRFPDINSHGEFGEEPSKI